jgi:hypothetical protein
MLEQLLNCPKHPEHNNYQYLPVSTSYQTELATVAEQLTSQHNKKNRSARVDNEFVANEVP